MPDRKLRVFLCHASQDKPVVRELYKRLLAEGWIDPWLDEEKLLPGQDWDMEITKALLDTDAVVVSLSKTSTTKEGYTRKEINNALEKLKEKPEDSNYFIPVRIEECSVPTQLTRWQYVDFFPVEQKDRAYQRLITSLKLRENILGINKAKKNETVSDEITLIEFGTEIALTLTLPSRQVLEFFRNKAGKFINAENMYIAIRNEDDDSIRFELMYEDGEPKKWPDRLAQDGLAGEIVRTRNSIFLPSQKYIDEWFDAHPNIVEAKDWMCWVGVPIVVRNKAIGMVCVFHPNKENVYDIRDREVLQILANLAGIALENSRLYREARGEIVAQRQIAVLGGAMTALEHRISNTLSIISPNLNRLRSRLPKDDFQVQEALDIIDRNTKLTSDLLRSIQARLIEGEYVDTSINSLVEAIYVGQMNEWRANSTNPSIETELQTDDRIPLVWLPSQIAEVVHNLIQNALRELGRAYPSTGGKLQVRTLLEGDKIYILVKDNVRGGIPESIKRRLFSQPVSSQNLGGGSGLGLWLSKLIMRSFNGDIRIEKTDLDGTIMLVEIPASG